MRTEADDAPKVAIRADLDARLAKAVLDAARADQRTVAGWVRHVLSQHLANDTGE